MRAKGASWAGTSHIVIGDYGCYYITVTGRGKVFLLAVHMDICSHYKHPLNIYFCYLMMLDSLGDPTMVTQEIKIWIGGWNPPIKF